MWPKLHNQHTMNGATAENVLDKPTATFGLTLLKGRDSEDYFELRLFPNTHSWPNIGSCLHKSTVLCIRRHSMFEIGNCVINKTVLKLPITLVTSVLMGPWGMFMQQRTALWFRGPLSRLHMYNVRTCMCGNQRYDWYMGWIHLCWSCDSDTCTNRNSDWRMCTYALHNMDKKLHNHCTLYECGWVNSSRLTRTCCTLSLGLASAHTLNPYLGHLDWS